MRGFVTNIVDVNTFIISTGEVIRLEGLETSGIDSVKGMKVKGRLEELVFNKNIDYKEQTRNSYGIIIAQVWVHGNNVNEAMGSHIKEL